MTTNNTRIEIFERLLNNLFNYIREQTGNVLLEKPSTEQAFVFCQMNKRSDIKRLEQDSMTLLGETANKLSDQDRAKIIRYFQAMCDLV